MSVAHQHATAVVRADVGVGHVEVLDDGALRPSEQARIGTCQDGAMVVEALDGVAVAVEGALERVVLRAERERSDLIDDGGDAIFGKIERLSVLASDVLAAQVEHIGDARRIHRARRERLGDEVVARLDVDGLTWLRIRNACGRGEQRAQRYDDSADETGENLACQPNRANITDQPPRANPRRQKQTPRCFSPARPARQCQDAPGRYSCAPGRRVRQSPRP